jgi:hypothetical protein
VSPGIAEGIVLIEQVVFTLEEDETIGIVGPMLARREVKLRAKRLIVFRLSEEAAGKTGQQK